MKDSAHFHQNLIFTACQAQDEAKVIEMVKVLAWHGVDMFEKDQLKQTPLFYAAKSGHTKVIQMMIENGLQINEIDTYG